MLFRFVEIQIKSGFVVTESWQVVCVRAAICLDALMMSVVEYCVCLSVRPSVSACVCVCLSV